MTCLHHSWRYLKTKELYDDDLVPGVKSLHWEDVFYCIHCLRYATREEILGEQEAEEAKTPMTAVDRMRAIRAVYLNDSTDPGVWVGKFEGRMEMGEE